MTLKAGYKLTDVGLIPLDWEVSSVGQEYDVQLGKMLDSDKNQGIEKPYIGNRAVQWGRVNIDDMPTMRMSATDLTRYRLREGDLLVCEGGEVGRSALWNAPISEAYYQKAIHRLRTRGSYDTRLTLALFRYWSDQGLLSNFVTQTSIAHLTKEKLLTIPMVKPSIEEQRAIATALSDIDDLIASLDALIAKKRDLKQAVMQQLIIGKTRLPGYVQKWDRLRLGDEAIFLKGKGLPKSALSPSGREPCIHYGELFTFYQETIESVVSRTNITGNLLRSVENDVLMPTSDVTPNGLAKASSVKEGGIVLGGDILVIRPNARRIYGPFLSYVIRYSEEKILSLVSGSTVFHIYAADMKGFHFDSPSIEEQKTIVSRLNEMTDAISQLKTKADKAREIKTGMMQQLLTGRIRLV